KRNRRKAKDMSVASCHWSVVVRLPSIIYNSQLTADYCILTRKILTSHIMHGRQLSRDTEHRKAMRRNLVQSLFEHGAVRTTMPKAKEVRSMAEKLITLAREGSLTARRRVISVLQDRRLVDEEQEFTGQTVVQKLFTDIAPKFKDRAGG